MMWLRSEVTEQRRRRLTARVLAQPSKVTEKQARSKPGAKIANIKRKPKQSVTREKFKAALNGHAKCNNNNSEFGIEDRPGSTQQYSNPTSIRKKVHKKIKSVQKVFENSETETPCSKGNRLLGKARNNRNIRGLKLKQNLVRSRKLNGIESNNQRTRILHRKSSWHRRNGSLSKEPYYENGLFKSKSYARCNGTTDEIYNQVQEKIPHKKISHGLIKNIKKRRVYSDEASKKKCKPVVSKIQQKSSFKISNGEHKCNINCCDKKCMNKNMDDSSNDVGRLNIVSEECLNRNNIVVLSQYVNPALRASSIKTKSTTVVTNPEGGSNTQEENAVPAISVETKCEEVDAKDFFPKQFVNMIDIEDACKMKEFSVNGFLQFKDCLKTDDCGWCHVSTETDVTQTLGE